MTLTTWLVLLTIFCAVTLAVRIGSPDVQLSRSHRLGTVAAALLLGVLVTVLAISAETSLISLVG